MLAPNKEFSCAAESPQPRRFYETELYLSDEILGVSCNDLLDGASPKGRSVDT